jgi:hypothetical protein
MDKNNLFEPVLDDDEEVVKVIRLHKGRAWFSTIVSLILFALVIVPVGVLMIIFHEPMAPDEEDMLGIGIMLLCFWGLVTLIAIVCVALWCSKTVYAWTNKRVLIRTGYIGVDYKSLDLNMVGALSVNVNIVDKLLHKNTGTIAFGSMASPMTMQNASKFSFSFIHDPYQIYKEVKVYIDQKKNSETVKTSTKATAKK